MTIPSSHHLDKYHISQAFDRAAQRYEQYATIQKEIGEQLLNRLQWLNITPHAILDAGAGTGRLTGFLSQKYLTAQIYALDLSEHMLQQARQPLSQPTSNRCVLICADAAQLPIVDDSIDLLISNLMLQWCNDMRAVLAEFARVLKPTGTLLFSTLGPDTLKELRQSWALVDGASHVNHFWDLHEIGDMLIQVGLNHPVMDVDWLTFKYADVFSLMRALKAVGAHNITAHRPRGLTGKNKLQAVLAHYEKYRLSEGLLPATYEVVYGYALGKKTVFPR